MALASRPRHRTRSSRRRSTTSTSTTSLGRKSSSHSSSSIGTCRTTRTSGNSSTLLVDRTFSLTATTSTTSVCNAHNVPIAIKYLQQVTVELLATKKHTDVRYVMTVRHHGLRVAWSHARSFDEYRKLQQRLVKKLQHGHFCDADCPWLYGFLKSYFPKKWVPTFSSARVVMEQRRQSLDRFFTALYGYLTEKKNECCAVVVTDFADELVKFIYGYALEQYGLEYRVKSTAAETGGLRWAGAYSSKLKETATSVKQHFRGRGMEQHQQVQYNRLSSSNDLSRESIKDDDVVNDLYREVCTICGSPLCGAAHGSSTSMSSSSNAAVLLLEEDENNDSIDDIDIVNDIDSSRSTVVSMDTGAGALSRANRNSSDSTGSVLTSSWIETLTSNGSSRAHNAGGPRPSKSSANRRRAATYYLTTLNCGHQFHDECIVAKLNESLECPTCGRIQTNA
uniref:RING-type domain-containing protein n=1 Tax=Peronospora matthiolae TaxID=2874970 RepID=A0AAV1USK3_9STRA